MRAVAIRVMPVGALCVRWPRRLGAQAMAQRARPATAQARKYYNDVAQDKDGFLAAYTGAGTFNASAAHIPPMSIPLSVPERIAPAPDAAIPAQLNNAKQAPVNVSMREPIGQDVGDRSIAHVVSGGLGMVG